MNLEIANRLLALRREHGYSQEELAYKLGVSRQAVSKWERADNLLALARLYGVSLDALLLHTPAGEAAQAAPEPEEAPADEDAEIFAAARAWDAAEEAEHAHHHHDHEHPRADESGRNPAHALARSIRHAHKICLPSAPEHFPGTEGKHLFSSSLYIGLRTPSIYRFTEDAIRR